MIKNKKAWLRIFEAFLAIILVMGVLLLFYSQSKETVDTSEYVYSFQMRILDGISMDSSLRGEVVTFNPASQNKLDKYALENIPADYDFELKVCGINEVCKMNNTNLKKTLDKEVFVEEKIVSGTLSSYNPKKVRLFVWGKA